MSYREQKKLFEDLRSFEHKFSSADKDLYKSFLKRHKDDEDLDTISMRKLKEMYEKYYQNQPKRDLNSLFKKEVEN